MIWLNHQLLFLLFVLFITDFRHASAGSNTSNQPEFARCIDKEREALLRFKQEMQDLCGLLATWGNQQGNRDCCNWRGVRCNNHTGHIIKLDLHGFINDCYVEDKLSDSLGDLKNLKYLDLSSISFDGPIPTFIGSLSKLEHLNLSDTNFYGEIPKQLGNLSHLTSLDLSYNPYLYADSLQWLSHLSLLKDLDLSYSNLSNTNDWFQAINNMPFLRILHLDFCFLPSTILPPFSFINSSSNLAVFSLADNFFTSSLIFEWLFNLRGINTQLVHLDLSHNSFSGPIPNEIGNLQSLRYLKLSNNLLSNSILDSLQNLKSLAYLDLSHNSFSSSIPSFLGNMLCLTHLDLSFNLLIGVIPPQLDRFRLLTTLDLSFNRLSGPIPSALGKFHEVMFLGNFLCGKPLLEVCPLEKGRDIALPQEENESKNDNFYVGLFVSSGIGFYLGFWGVCATLVLKHEWRYAIFQFVDNVFNRIYVIIAIYIARRSKRNSGQNM